MIPRSITRKLAGLRGRERLLQLAWGVARWLAVILMLLLIAGAIDWLIDRDQDTPWPVRYALFFTQLIVALTAAVWFLIRPLSKRLRDDILALRVEERYPALRHRLITAVQLNKPDADTEGMSVELIALVTGQAEQQVRSLDFPAVADHRRLKWSLRAFAPAVILFALPFTFWPGLALTLLMRQFLADFDIPHRYSLFADDRDIRPSGEKLALQITVRGPDLGPNQAGEVTVRPDGHRQESYPLEFVATNGPDEAVYETQLPASSVNFIYSARLGDGRLRRPGRIRFEPRPIVTEVQGWVVLPAFCGVDEHGNRYEQPQARGDIVGIGGSFARVRIYTQKPIVGAALKLFGPVNWDRSKPVEETSAETITRDLVALEIRNVETANADGVKATIQFAEATFEMRDNETAYQIEVVDEYGFTNQPPPRRKIRVVEEEKPQVTLLKEQFPPSSRLFSSDTSADYEVEGMPVPLGKDIRVAYVSHGPYGLGQARLLYRVLKKVESGNDEAGPNPWIALPLQEVVGSEATGPFDPRLGVFQKSGPREQVFFTAAQGPGSALPRSLGGGRFDFKTTGIPDGKGDYLQLKIGDQIEFCIEIFADKDMKANRPTNRSESRVKTIVSDSEFALWLADAIQEERRLRELDAKQRGLFEDK
ncbi:MAG: hypothetical protein HY040_19140 [Planctomycetes bacterium]|nr:hypothetical protein [Planctomycetota bacterium]